MYVYIYIYMHIYVCSYGRRRRSAQTQNLQDLQLSVVICHIRREIKKANQTTSITIILLTISIVINIILLIILLLQLRSPRGGVRQVGAATAIPETGMYKCICVCMYTYLSLSLYIYIYIYLQGVLLQLREKCRPPPAQTKNLRDVAVAICFTGGSSMAKVIPTSVKRYSSGEEGTREG